MSWPRSSGVTSHRQHQTGGAVATRKPDAGGRRQRSLPSAALAAPKARRRGACTATRKPSALNRSGHGLSPQDSASRVGLITESGRALPCLGGRRPTSSACTPSTPSVETTELHCMPARARNSGPHPRAQARLPALRANRYPCCQPTHPVQPPPPPRSILNAKMINIEVVAARDPGRGGGRRGVRTTRSTGRGRLSDRVSPTSERLPGNRSPARRRTAGTRPSPP